MCLNQGGGWRRLQPPRIIKLIDAHVNCRKVMSEMMKGPEEEEILMEVSERVEERRRGFSRFMLRTEGGRLS